MLTIRLQRRGRSGHAQFRLVVQDSRFHPTSGRVVAYVGSYDPHTKATTLDGEKISTYLSSGAQPSDKVAKLLQKAGIKLPNWFKAAAPRTGKVRNPEKRRSTRLPSEGTPTEPEAQTANAETPTEAPAAEVPETKSAEEEKPADLLKE
ncbi:30S ribosomal protein S16 [Candidatus Saccharibacteria bacterium]|nr:30S ribosomal protein S16 [Candidatus Saccharibacteria bacterium]